MSNRFVTFGVTGIVTVLIVSVGIGGKSVTDHELSSLVGGQDPVCLKIDLDGHCNRIEYHTGKQVYESCPGWANFKFNLNAAGNYSKLTRQTCYTPCSLDCGRYVSSYADCEGIEVIGTPQQ
jgi:hypothetical protein